MQMRIYFDVEFKKSPQQTDPKNILLAVIKNDEYRRETLAREGIVDLSYYSESLPKVIEQYGDYQYGFIAITSSGKKQTMLTTATQLGISFKIKKVRESSRVPYLIRFIWHQRKKILILLSTARKRDDFDKAEQILRGAFECGMINFFPFTQESVTRLDGHLRDLGYIPEDVELDDGPKRIKVSEPNGLKKDGLSKQIVIKSDKDWEKEGFKIEIKFNVSLARQKFRTDSLTVSWTDRPNLGTFFHRIDLLSDYIEKILP